MIGVIVLHEVVHALTYAIVCGVSLNEIDVVVELVPEKPLELVSHSVHPARPIRRWKYSVGVDAPTLVLGVVPASIGPATGTPLATFVGLLGLFLISTEVGAIVEAWRYRSDFQ